MWLFRREWECVCSLCVCCRSCEMCCWVASVWREMKKEKAHRRRCGVLCVESEWILIHQVWMITVEKACGVCSTSKRIVWCLCGLYQKSQFQCVCVCDWCVKRALVLRSVLFWCGVCVFVWVFERMLWIVWQRVIKRNTQGTLHRGKVEGDGDEHREDYQIHQHSFTATFFFPKNTKIILGSVCLLAGLWVIFRGWSCARWSGYVFIWFR